MDPMTISSVPRRRRRATDTEVAAAVDHSVVGNVGRDGAATDGDDLASKALSLLLSHRVEHGGGGSTGQGGTTYVAPCRTAQTVQESTSALLAARSYAKSGRSSIAWDVLDAVLDVQGSNGFVPRFRYVIDGGDDDGDGANDDADGNGGREGGGSHYYLPGTSYPGPDLFGPVPAEYSPQSPPSNNKRTRGSGRIAAMPLHATAALHVFYLSRQSGTDVDRLESTYRKLYRWHGFLHKRVTVGCDGSSIDGGGVFVDREAMTARAAAEKADKPPSPPCYNVLHPWETEIDWSSPFWEDALRPIIDLVKRIGWTPAFDVPTEVTDAYDYPGNDVYGAMLHLIECHANATTEASTLMADGGGGAEWDYEARIAVGGCPFALVDVGFAAALSRSDSDLLQIAQILIDKDSPLPPTKTELDRISGWSKRSSRMLEGLWDADRRAFLNRAVLYAPARNDIDGSQVANGTRPVSVPIANNFFAAWDDLSDPSRVEAEAFQVLQREGAFAFGCGGLYPIASVGGCGRKNEVSLLGAVSDDDRTLVLVSPALNYWVSSGFYRNKAIGVGHYIRNSTLNLVCGLPNSDEYQLNETCTGDVVFAKVYRVSASGPLSTDPCDLSSTATAAVVYDMIVPDGPFRFQAAPPMSSSWVLVLIALELAIAFSIGVSCLVLSLNLMRRLKADDDGDAFVRMLHHQQPDFSGLYGDDARPCDDGSSVGFDSGSFDGDADKEQGSLRISDGSADNAQRPTTMAIARNYLGYLNPFSALN